MSLYACIDLINNQLDQLNSGGLPLLQRAIHFISGSAKMKHDESSFADQIFLNTLKDNFTKRIQENNYENLSSDIKSINEYVETKKHSLSYDCLKYITDDLTTIEAKLQSKTNKSQLTPDAATGTPSQSHSPSMVYEKFQSPDYLIAEIKQGKLYKMGMSAGECLGFTYSMANPTLSPYDNPGRKIDLNQEIHNYQKFQADREKDQATIKYSRLTREHFCPDQEKQAKEILEFAEQHKGKDLYLSRRDSKNAHACYLSVRENGDIRYMDSNHGAYLFKNKQDFLDFYIAAAGKEKEVGVDFRFYTISELKYDKDMSLQETKTFQGILRTLLTGTKYGDNGALSYIVSSGVYMAIGGGLSGGVGAGIGALVGSVVPIVGTLIGATIGALIGATVGITLGAGLTTIATSKGHVGLLGVPHLIQDTWQNIKEKISNFIFPSPKKNLSRASTEVITDKDSSLCSTASILSSLNFSPSSPPSSISAAPDIGNDNHVVLTPVQATIEKDKEREPCYEELSSDKDRSINYRN
ncbi:hypothetical protein [Legionella rowbothamii]|uniref:hypothetical protein n=1 Tax=Legionella rowbothamii TaxID=96229 RepID=UPI0010553CE1|nr:hypothetical protein [Legionella rowbothamii]